MRPSPLTSATAPSGSAKACTARSKKRIRGVALGHERAHPPNRWLKSIGPVFNCGKVRLGSLLVGAQCWLVSVRGVKLEPALPTSVGSLFTADPHDVSGIAFDDLDWMFAD